MRTLWRTELRQVILLLLLSLFAGQLSGYWGQFLFIGLLLYTLRNLYQLRCLIHWLSHPSENTIPKYPGIWEAFYVDIKQKNEQHQQQLNTLKKQFTQLRESIETFPDAIVALNQAGEIQWFNQIAQQYLALHHPQDIKRPLINLFRHPAVIRYLQKDGFDKPLEVAAPGLNDCTLSIRIAPYGDGQKLFLAQNITERLRVDQTRKDFVANVSHELRTPLTVISGFLENMYTENMPNGVEHWHKPLTLMIQQTEHMRRIVKDLLLLTRLEGGADNAHRELIDIANMANEIKDESQLWASDKLKITLHLKSTKQLMGNPAQLRSAFTNLVTNAINYTPQYGHIWLTWSTDEAGGYFVVEDNGEGISKAHISRLTERFYRTDIARSRNQGGTGLGLAIVKHVLQAHGATLEINSTINVGSRFCCNFPFSRLRENESPT